MKKSPLKILVLLFAAAALVCSCGKEDSKKAKRSKEPAAVVEAAPEVEKPAVKEVEDKPVQDKHFLSVDLPAEDLKTGGVLRADVEIAVKFENPFDSRDISVEAYVSGDSNGYSANIPLFFVGGDSAKSKWRLSSLLEKSGSYKCVFNIHAKGGNYFSLEYPFKVSKGGEPEYLKLKKRDYSRFSGAGDFAFRGMGLCMNLNVGADAQEAAFKKMQEAGANVVRLSIEAPLTLFVARDTETAKAGQINLGTVGLIESFMDRASKYGIYTILDFASPLSFGDNVYANSYFAQSGLAKTPAEFFTSMEAQQAYFKGVSYLVSRLAPRKDLLMWQPFSGIDSFDRANFDARVMWLSNLVVNMRDLPVVRHPILLAAGTSSEIEFLWGADYCDMVVFDVLDSKDFAQAVDSHAGFFSKKYRRAAGVGKYGFDAEKNTDPTLIFAHNAVWAGFFTNSPLLPLADFSKTADADAALRAMKGVSEFAKAFGLGAKRLEPISVSDVVASASNKPMENFALAEPAFSETMPSRESSNDIAGIELSPNGTVVKNTMSAVWKKGALISFKIDNVPSPKCLLTFDIVGISKGDSATVSITRNDDPVSKIQISSDGAKKFATVFGIETALVNRSVSVPLDKGDQNVVFQILSDKDAALTVANFKVYGMGSNKGFGSVRVYAAAEKNGTSRYLWFKRAGTDTANFSKYKLYERELPDVKPSDFTLDIEGGAGKTFKVTWWDTRENKEIVSGVVKCGADSKLKLRTPPFKLDTACAVEEAK